MATGAPLGIPNPAGTASQSGGKFRYARERHPPRSALFVNHRGGIGSAGLDPLNHTGRIHRAVLLLVAAEDCVHRD